MYINIYNVDYFDEDKNKYWDAFCFIYNEFGITIKEKAPYTCFVLTSKDYSLDTSHVIGIAQVYQNKSPNIHNLISKSNHKVLLNTIISIYKEKNDVILYIENDDENECIYEVLDELKFKKKSEHLYILNIKHDSKYFNMTTAQSFMFNEKKYIILSTIDDGSCFFHSLLYSIHPSYYLLNLQDKVSAVRTFRASLASKITIDVYNSLGGGELSKVKSEMYMANNNIPISGNIPENITELCCTKFKKDIENPSKWVGEEAIELVFNLFNIGILLFTSSNNLPVKYSRSMPDNYFKECKIFSVMWYKNSHYDVVINSNGIRNFELNSDIVKFFK